MVINIKIRADGDKLSDSFRDILLKDDKVEILGINNLKLQHQNYSAEESSEEMGIDLEFIQTND